MNSLNPLYIVNRAVFVANLILYLAVTPGMAFQVILGITQIVSAMYLTINFYKNVSNILRVLLKTYWILTLLVFIMMDFIENIFSTPGAIICFVIPMLIATLFMYLLFRFKKEING